MAAATTAISLQLSLRAKPIDVVSVFKQTRPILVVIQSVLQILRVGQAVLVACLNLGITLALAYRLCPVHNLVANFGFEVFVSWFYMGGSTGNYWSRMNSLS